MATPNVLRVPIKLDRQRNIVLDLNAYCMAEELTGKNFMKRDVWDNLSFRDVRALTFAGLLHDDPKITIENVGAMIHVGNLEAVSNALTSAFLNSLPEPEPEEGKAVPLDVAADAPREMAISAS